jgi:hypothetical protein
LLLIINESILPKVPDNPLERTLVVNVVGMVFQSPKVPESILGAYPLSKIKKKIAKARSWSLYCI